MLLCIILLGNLFMVSSNESYLYGPAYEKWLRDIHHPLMADDYPIEYDRY